MFKTMDKRRGTDMHGKKKDFIQGAIVLNEFILIQRFCDAILKKPDLKRKTFATLVTLLSAIN